MKKPSTEKQAFYNLLNLAVRKGEKSVSQKQTQKKDAGCSGKQTHQRKTEGALRK